MRIGDLEVGATFVAKWNPAIHGVKIGEQVGTVVSIQQNGKRTVTTWSNSTEVVPDVLSVAEPT